jgi:hypothetical protein
MKFMRQAGLLLYDFPKYQLRLTHKLILLYPLVSLNLGEERQYNSTTCQVAPSPAPQPSQHQRKSLQMKFALLYILVAVVSIGRAQNKSTGNASTKGGCSPGVTGSGNTFYYKYCGSDPEERARIFKLLIALSKGQDLTIAKLDQILELIGQPPKIFEVRSGQESAAPGKPPQASVTFYTEEPVARGQFEVHCDRPCSPVGICTLIGGNNSLLATVSTDPNLAEFIFRREFPSLTQCKLTVESRDMNPVIIINLSVSRQMENLIPNKNQPPGRVAAPGSVLQ